MLYMAVGKNGNRTREDDMLGACRDYWELHGESEDLDVYEARIVLPATETHPALISAGRKVTRMLREAR